MFTIAYLVDPASINLTEAEGNACGRTGGGAGFYCYGGGSAIAFHNGWKTFLSSNRGSLEDVGIATDIIDEAMDCELLSYDIYPFPPPSNTFVILGSADWLQFSSPFPEGHEYYGLSTDAPAMGYATATAPVAGVLVPEKWILDNIETTAELFPPSESAYRAFGGKTASATNDKMNSVPPAHREAGFMRFFVFGGEIAKSLGQPQDANAAYNDDFFRVIFPNWFDTSDKSNFPGFIGSNHAAVDIRGPLKSDWTKACPLDWSQRERDEKCISLQECIWGTKLLKKLEEIKEAIDPNYMFDCNGCVGNNRVKSAPTDDGIVPSKTAEEEEKEPTAVSGACYDMGTHTCGCGPTVCNPELCTASSGIWSDQCSSHCTECDPNAEVTTQENGKEEEHDSHDEEEGHGSHDHDHDHNGHDEEMKDSLASKNAAFVGSLATAALLAVLSW